jgi:hypothetical protein
VCRVTQLKVLSLNLFISLMPAVIKGVLQPYLLSPLRVSPSALCIGSSSIYTHATACFSTRST